MLQFNPQMEIVAVDADAVVVTFDFASSGDSNRAPRALRIPRNFAELTVSVKSFESLGELADKAEYRGAITLVVKPLAGEAVEHVLAEPRLWLDAQSRNRRKSGPLFNFYSPDEVTQGVRDAVAEALARALFAFYSNESRSYALDTTPASSAGVAPQRAFVAAVRAPVYQPNRTAANDPAARKRFRGRVVLAAVVTPLLVFGLLTLGGALKKDPIQDAVAKAMTHTPSSTQAQVELTKETLKQMGLDPGKSGDIGCLAPQ